MKKVILEKIFHSVYLSDIAKSTPIFTKKNGKLTGMIVNVGTSYDSVDDSKWIHMIGGAFGSTGYYSSREECCKAEIGMGYELFIED